MAGRSHITLSHRLLVALGVVSFLFWAVMTTLSTRDNITQVNELYDVHLAHTAKAFLQMMDPDHNEEFFPTTMSSAAIDRLFNSWPELPNRASIFKNPAAPPENVSSAPPGPKVQPDIRPPGSRKTQYGSSLRYQLWRDDGHLLFRSDNAPLDRMTKTMGYSDNADEQGKGWRNYHVHDTSHGVKIIVSEPHDFRAKLVRNMVIAAATPLALGLPVLFLLLWFSIRKGLHPLATLSQEISKRQPNNLTLIDARSVPDEVQPIVTALNDLLTRMGQTLDHERRFTDDAAHQLRTPLAAIQAQLYVARHTQAEAPRQLALEQMQHSVERGIRLVNQLLTLARLDPKQARPEFQSLRLEKIAETICAELAPLALQREQSLELVAEPDLPPVSGNADMLAMLLSNLVDNAIHYTPRGGNILIDLQADGSGVQLSVCDDGPGIAPGQRHQVFERFYRIAEQSQPGTGLGLAICKRVADLHHASLTLADGLTGRGLCVRLHLTP
ncbi:sensor histidine kinase [Rhodoferax sp.]|uniref:sensor histidine kinase n=1 Tax=Rhodoferax sp. TaxID=50421 RepID=UPI002730A133|nr:ATP-binding protein [Rhodoferax sp.]MDP1528706.1 ATP-binding protein [Rhodoferax sp.]MDP1943809.1 ATP-binding protein [Rhodoferax sp.]MDP2441877.1 ATP-binding protein [Rhodoferax sp.]MDZ4208107.1 ATP-binding protein [Rhodoferax sp.]